MSRLGGLFSRILGVSRSIPPSEARELVKGDDVVVLDVRREGEFRSGHLRGAKHVPVGLVKKRAARLDPDVTYLVYCRSGSRSRKAAAALTSEGFQSVYDLRGGILAWENQGYPVRKGNR